MVTRFSLKLATLASDERYGSLSFSSYMDGSVSFLDPIISRACGAEVNYGELFAYCFRRFGYPNFGWDDHKELTCYLLTTPRKDMLLRVRPSVGSDADLCFQFLVPLGVTQRASQYGRRFRMAWQQRALDWQEQKGLPNWMPEWVSFYNNALRGCYFSGDIPEARSWRDCAEFRFPYGEPGSEIRRLTQRTVDFYKELHEGYALVEPYPDYAMRSADWQLWSDEDPLKPYADAAFVALSDLARTVGVRDQDINAYGLQEGPSKRSAKAAPVSGFPAGALGNVAPEEMAALHRKVLQLGKGNVKRGLTKALALLEAAVPTKPSKG